LWIPLFTINTKLAFLLLLAMIGIATFVQQQLSADGYQLESVFQLTYVLWLIFALTLNAYIALSCPN
jgi:hypothetical protein